MKRAKKRTLKKGQSPAGRWKAPTFRKGLYKMDSSALKELGYQARAKSLALEEAELAEIYETFGIDPGHLYPETQEEKEQDDANWAELILNPDKGSLKEVRNLRAKLRALAKGINLSHHIVMPDGMKMFFEPFGSLCFFMDITPGICIKRSIPYNSRERAKLAWGRRGITWERTFIIVDGKPKKA